jgi:hypothetical protein
LFFSSVFRKCPPLQLPPGAIYTRTHILYCFSPKISHLNVCSYLFIYLAGELHNHLIS